MWWIGVPVFAVILLFLAQGSLLQLSVALVGEPAPKYGRALWTWMVAGLLAAVASATYGLTFGWFVPSAIDVTISGVLLVGITALVYKRQLGTSFLTSVIVSLLHNAFAAGLSALTWTLVNYVR
jgi:hypothetical protein